MEDHPSNNSKTKVTTNTTTTTTTTTLDREDVDPWIKVKDPRVYYHHLHLMITTTIEIRNITLRGYQLVFYQDLPCLLHPLLLNSNISNNSIILVGVVYPGEI